MSNTQIIINTSEGNIFAELVDEKAPKTVQNFIQYIKKEHFSNTIFHRVIKGFMIQGGGFDTDFDQKPTDKAIEIESNNGLKNTKGTLAMARTQDPNSATAQFFINLVDNDFLNYTESTVQGYGYTVFGKVIDGMDVVEKIGQAPTENKGMHQDVPVENIVINSITLTTDDA